MQTFVPAKYSKAIEVQYMIHIINQITVCDISSFKALFDFITFAVSFVVCLIYLECGFSGWLNFILMLIL